MRLLRGGSGMVFEPGLRRVSGQRFELIARRDDTTIVPWGFWGGVLTLTAGVLAIAYVGAVGLWSTWNALWPLLLMAVGLALLKFGRRTSLTQIDLGHVDLSVGRLALAPPRPDTRGTAGGDGEEQAAAQEAVEQVLFEEITEVIFGMTRFALAPDDQRIKVQAYSLLVRTIDDALVPVVEASPDKEAVYALAQFLSRVVGAPLSQVGIGVK